MFKTYTFNIVFVVSHCEDAGFIEIENDRLINCGIEEKIVAFSALSYESARDLAYALAADTIRNFYEPLGVWAAFRVEKTEAVI